MKVHIETLDGRPIAQTFFLPGDGNRWGWIADTIAEEFSCDPDDVHDIEDDGGETVAIGDKPVARVIKHYGWRAL